MRIIGGEFRGRRLQTPKGRNIRPTSDRVREAIFNVIAACIAEADVLDLFAGTGALGLEALSRGPVSVFGEDYDTRDGTCLRDYVHVLDLADAHVRAIERLLAGGDSCALNLGSGDGVTVRELLASIERVTGRKVPASPAPRREGDAPALLADNALVRRELGWSPQRDIDQIIADAWKWHSVVEKRIFNDV